MTPPPEAAGKTLKDAIEWTEEVRKRLKKQGYEGLAKLLGESLVVFRTLEATSAKEGEALSRVRAKVEAMDAEVRGIRTYKVMSGFRSDYYIPLPQVISAIQRLKIWLAEIDAESEKAKEEGQQ